MRQPGLDLLASLDVLLSEGNVTRAAARLGLTQPALSAQLRQLRALLGDPLLLPEGRRMIPTDRARHLQAPLRRLLDDLRGLLDSDRAFDPARDAAVFRLATTDSIQAIVCAPLLALLRREAPSTRLAILTADPRDLEAKLVDGRIDLVLATPAIMPGSALTAPLYDERFLCAVRPDHPVVAAGLDLDQFCRLDHLLVSTSGGGFVGIVDDALAAFGRSRRVVASVPSFLGVPDMLRASDLIATVPARSARQWRDRLAVFEPPCEIGRFPVQIGWHRRSQSNPALAWLRRRIEALMAGGPITAVGGD